MLAIGGILQRQKNPLCAGGGDASPSSPPGSATAYSTRILGMFSLDLIADVVAPRCEDPKLIICVISFELVQPIRPRNIVSDGQTDDLRQQYCALHYVHRTICNYRVLSFNIPIC